MKSLKGGKKWEGLRISELEERQGGELPEFPYCVPYTPDSCRNSNSEPSTGTDNKSSKKNLFPVGKGSEKGRPYNRKPFWQYSP